jgi:hypothetical protein
MQHFHGNHIITLHNKIYICLIKIGGKVHTPLSSYKVAALQIPSPHNFPNVLIKAQLPDLKQQHKIKSRICGSK